MNSGKHKVVLVGGFGFIGQAVLELLIENDFETIVLDDLSAPVGDAVRKFKAAKFRKLDIADFSCDASDNLEGATWVHLAAVPFIPDTFIKPWLTVRTNLLGTLRACRVALSTRAQRFLYISTSEVYGESARGAEPLREGSPTNPKSLYALSKLGAEGVVKEFGELPWVILRPFNSYGPNATHPYFVPEMIRQCMKADEIRVGNLDSARDFTFVADTASAILAAVRMKGIERETINVCSGRAWRMSDLLMLIQECCNASKKRVVTDHSRIRPPGTDPDTLLGTFEKAGELLDWEPKISIETGIKRTLVDFISNRGWPYEAANG